jgi:hypothetical protein
MRGRTSLAGVVEKRWWTPPKMRLSDTAFSRLAKLVYESVTLGFVPVVTEAVTLSPTYDRSTSTNAEAVVTPRHAEARTAVSDGEGRDPSATRGRNTKVRQTEGRLHSEARRSKLQYNSDDY